MENPIVKPVGLVLFHAMLIEVDALYMKKTDGSWWQSELNCRVFIVPKNTSLVIYDLS